MESTPDSIIYILLYFRNLAFGLVTEDSLFVPLPLEVELVLVLVEQRIASQDCLLFTQPKFLQLFLLFTTGFLLSFSLNSFVFHHHLKLIIVFTLIVAILMTSDWTRVTLIEIEVGILMKRVDDVNIEFQALKLLVLFFRRGRPFAEEALVSSQFTFHQLCPKVDGFCILSVSLSEHTLFKRSVRRHVL